MLISSSIEFYLQIYSIQIYFLSHLRWQTAPRPNTKRSFRPISDILIDFYFPFHQNTTFSYYKIKKKMQNHMIKFLYYILNGIILNHLALY